MRSIIIIIVTIYIRKFETRIYFKFTGELGIISALFPIVSQLCSIGERTSGSAMDISVLKELAPKLR